MPGGAAEVAMEIMGPADRSTERGRTGVVMETLKLRTGVVIEMIMLRTGVVIEMITLRTGVTAPPEIS